MSSSSSCRLAIPRESWVRDLTSTEQQSTDSSRPGPTSSIAYWAWSVYGCLPQLWRPVILAHLMAATHPCSLRAKFSPLTSPYKSHCTFKAMVGMSPHGALTSVSRLFEGFMSDKVFCQSGITSLLTLDMATVADKGLLVDGHVPSTLYLPSSPRGPKYQR